MGQIDVAKVITAAAASSLGVLSLLILAVAFVGYNFFKHSGDRVKIGVFAVMALAAIGFGVSVVREGREQSAVAATTREPQVARSEPLPGATVAAPRSDPSPGATAAVPRSDPSPVATAAAVPAADIAGVWHDDEDYLYDLKVDGTRLSYVQTKDGARTGSAYGTVVGRKLDYTYVNDLTVDRGTCSGRLSKDGTRIDGSCGSSGGGQRWGFAIMR